MNKSGYKSSLWVRTLSFTQLESLFPEDREYSSTELDELAEGWLDWSSMTETCPECGEVEVAEPGELPDIPTCPQGHTWKRSATQRRGVGGDNAVLLSDHYKVRLQHEIYAPSGVIETPQRHVKRHQQYRQEMD